MNTLRARAVTICAVLLSVAALAVASCSSGGSNSLTTTPSSDTRAPRSTSTSPSPPPDSPTSESPTTTSPRGHTPGGTAGKDTVEHAKLLDEQGRVSPGPTAPKDPKVQSAICDYVFGTPEDVADTAKLEDTPTLTDDSGYLYEGGGGSGVLCSYEVDGDAVFSLIIWDQDTGGASKATHLVTVDLPDGFHGGSAYKPGYTGPAMSDATAKQWLRDAATRVTHGSV